jgi:hypothetical protein
MKCKFTAKHPGLFFHPSHNTQQRPGMMLPPQNVNTNRAVKNGIVGLSDLKIIIS